MRRRHFICFIGSAVAVLPYRFEAWAEDDGQKKMARIGFLNANRVSQPLLDAFNRGLIEQGYVEGRNIVIERRPAKDREELLKSIAEFVAIGVEVIVAPSTPEAIAAASVTKTVPIVTISADAIAAGLAASLSRPGGNVTGLTAVTGLADKAFGILAEVVPGASRFATLLDPGNPLHSRQLTEINSAAARLHLELIPVTKQRAEDIDPAFATMVAKGVEGLVVLGDPIAFANRRKIIELAAQYRIPAVYRWREDALEGGLLAYGADLPDLYRRSAAYVAKLLAGAKAAELPIEQSQRFLLVVNLKTAKALGLTIPPPLLATADEVIE